MLPNPSNEVDYNVSNFCSTRFFNHFASFYPRRNFAVGAGFCYIWLAGGYGSDGHTAELDGILLLPRSPSQQRPPQHNPPPPPPPMRLCLQVRRQRRQFVLYTIILTQIVAASIQDTQPADFFVNLSDPDGSEQCPSPPISWLMELRRTVTQSSIFFQIVFHFNASPVVQGLNVMHIPACAFNCSIGCTPEFTCTFTYQPSTPTPTPTATVTPTPTVTPTSTPRPSPTPRGTIALTTSL